jgi:large conductance mechanosensitive channel
LSKSEDVEEKEPDKLSPMETNQQILLELRTIRDYLAPPKEEEPPEEEEEKGPFKTFIDDFILFLKQYKVIGLAVAFIMAIYLGALVQALVDDLLMPILEYIPGLDSWATFTAGPFLIGHFVSTFVTFLLIAFVVYLLVKLTKKIGLQ